jgi:uncharacterized coiled-coil protein SlyX
MGKLTPSYVNPKTDCKQEPTMSDPAAEERLIRLETAVAHLEFTLEQLSGVVASQSQRLGELRARLDHWEAHRTRDDQADPPSSPLDERPPHY